MVRFEITLYLLSLALFPLFSLSSFLVHERNMSVNSSSSTFKSQQVVLQSGADNIILGTYPFSRCHLAYSSPCCTFIYPPVADKYAVPSYYSHLTQGQYESLPPSQYSLDIVHLHDLRDKVKSMENQIEKFEIY